MCDVLRNDLGMNEVKGCQNFGDWLHKLHLFGDAEKVFVQGQEETLVWCYMADWCLAGNEGMDPKESLLGAPSLIAHESHQSDGVMHGQTRDVGMM